MRCLFLIKGFWNNPFYKLKIRYTKLVITKVYPNPYKKYIGSNGCTNVLNAVILLKIQFKTAPHNSNKNRMIKEMINGRAILSTLLKW